MRQHAPEIPGREMYRFETFTFQTHIRRRNEIFWVLAQKIIKVPQREFLSICQRRLTSERDDDCDTVEFHSVQNTIRASLFHAYRDRAVAGKKPINQADPGWGSMWMRNGVLRPAQNSPCQ